MFLAGARRQKQSSASSQKVVVGSHKQRYTIAHSPGIPDFLRQRSPRNYNGSTPNRGAKSRVQSTIFDQLSQVARWRNGQSVGFAINRSWFKSYSGQSYATTLGTQWYLRILLRASKFKMGKLTLKLNTPVFGMVCHPKARTWYYSLPLYKIWRLWLQPF